VQQLEPVRTLQTIKSAHENCCYAVPRIVINLKTLRHHTLFWCFHVYEMCFSSGKITVTIQSGLLVANSFFRLRRKERASRGWR